jgi:predicted amidophosphoribosyltransferase
MQRAKDVMFAIKTDSFVEQLGQPPSLMSQWIGKTIREEIHRLPFATLFLPGTVLVPVPSSSLMQRDSLWVPDRIATALVANGIGKEIARYLTRARPLRKAAFSDASERPTPAEQFDTLAVQGQISAQPSQITLVDDIVTRGATLLGAANRLAEVLPSAQIQAFAAMRTANPTTFVDPYDPKFGTITYRELTQDTIRRP